MLPRPRKHRSRCFLVLLCCAALFTGTLCTAVFAADEAISTAALPSFASLTITPAGDEAFDFSTGITTLATGGQVSDRQSGITLDAEHIRYKVDDFIEATGVRVSGSFGTIQAAALRIDIPAAIMSASGDLQLQSLTLTVTGQTLDYHTRSGIIDLLGSVTATTPEFSAERLLHDEHSGTTLLFGPYSYSDGFLVLSAEEGTKLELLPVKNELDVTTGFSASSTPAAATLQLFSPYLQ